MKRVPIKVLALAAALAAPASASERAAVSRAALAPAPTAGEPVNASVSYTINLPLSEGAMLVDAANNRAYKRSLYQKAAGECEDFLATIAKRCQITSINVSTNENRNAGQPATLYVSVNVSMQFVPK
ncbi:MAG: hypothetical protein ABL957_16005 [Parvularculaceae bacterium]